MTRPSSCCRLRAIGPLIAIITVGICVGFLPHNFNPAKIFMGDGGALLLGLLLAVSTSVVGGRADPNLQGYAGQTYFFLAPLFIPLFILGVPILDTLFAIVRRATRRQGVATADKRHLHHRLMEMGHGQRRSVDHLVGVDRAAVGIRVVPGADTELHLVRADRRGGARACCCTPCCIHRSAQNTRDLARNCDRTQPRLVWSRLSTFG